MDRRHLAGALFFLLAAGCASVPSQRAVAVREVDIDAVAGCENLGNVTGRSMLGGTIGGGTGKNNSRVSAKEQAAQRGATHIVWIAEGSVFTSAVGQAYRCGG